MDADNAAKMSAYKENVGKIATYLHNNFYKLDCFDAYATDESVEMEKNMCLDKAERLYQFFDSTDDIKRMMAFLNTVNPGMAKELVDGL